MKAVRNYTWKGISVLGAVGGMAANSHSLNVVAISVFILVLFLSKKRTKNNLLKIAFCLILVLIFGGLHYILDTFWGTGWIFTRLES
jgi:hypothetical protein